MKSPTGEAQFLTPREAAQLLGISVTTVRELAADGRLPGAVDLGRGAHHEWRFHKPTLVAGLAGQQPTSLHGRRAA